MNNPSKVPDDKIDRHDALRTALIVTALFWVLLVAALNSSMGFLAKLRGILGEEPNGLRFDLYILLFTFQLAVPMIFFLYHALIVLTHAKRHQATPVHAGDVGAVIGLIGYLRYLLRDSSEGPVIRRSKRITLAGIFYFVGIIAWWIYWTDKHGI
jgi:hypothetical protein